MGRRKSPATIIKGVLETTFLDRNSTLSIMEGVAKENLALLEKKPDERGELDMSRKEIVEIIKNLEGHRVQMENELVDLSNLIEDNVDNEGFKSMYNRLEDIIINIAVLFEFVNQNELRVNLKEALPLIKSARGIAEAMYNVIDQYRDEMLAAASYRSAAIVRSYFKGWMAAGN